MNTDAFDVVRTFEAALCEYTGAPYAVAVNSCTMALLLAVAWHLEQTEIGATGVRRDLRLRRSWGYTVENRCEIEIPKRTYLSVPMSIMHAGGRPTFREEDWRGAYQLKPLQLWDCARRFHASMYQNWVSTVHERPHPMQCVSFHHSKILGDTQGGAILHDDPEADQWLRRARFDGRAEHVAPKDDQPILGWHCYLSPDVAARLLWKLDKLPMHNDDLPPDDYPDLSQLECFR